MAKTIKFNLICDGNPVRTLEDLQHNFSIEDVFEYYSNGLLQKWLAVRGYDDQLKKVKAITAKDAITILLTLIDIFEVEADKEKVRENTFILKYKKERELLLDEYEKMNFKSKKIIDDYHTGYKELIDTIVNNKDDISIIKAAIIKMEEHYYPLFEYHHCSLFYNLLDKAPMAVLCMIMREKMRLNYVPQADEEAASNIERDEMYECICEKMTYEELSEMLQGNLKEFAGITDGYWKDVETKKKRYLILNMEYGNLVRSTGVLGLDLSADAINDKFIILDGIDYKSNSATHKLLYMEV